MPKITINDLLKKKADHKKISMLTAYDYPFAKIVDEAGVDVILVGDSVGMVVQGLDNTLPVIRWMRWFIIRKWFRERSPMRWLSGTFLLCPTR